MYFLIYVSSAVEPFSNEELRALLEKARAANVRAGVTGLLLYKDGNFMQMLEGEQHAVEAIQAKIVADTRHKGIITLLKGQTATREFSEWSMGFRNLHTPEASRTPGYSEFLNTSLSSAEFTDNPSRTRKLLLLFKEKM
jgi:hypothetical protein